MDPGSTAYRDDIGEWLPAQRHTGKTSRVVDLDPGSEAYRDDEEEGQNKAKPGSRHLKAHSKWFEHYG